ncbi:SMYD5 [Bugula neritina]|uniref:SMYD5 n=1 Tax=Bugula neritina TaxID=10212 RepID=A0A7J7JQQ5_BUGNE|nr:SMYD5 [Bugula neritina]
MTEDGFNSLLAMIGTNGQGIGTSSLSVWVKNCDALELPEEPRQQLEEFIDGLYQKIEEAEGTQDAFLNCEGSGLYLRQSAANHSCMPNAETSFPYNNSVLRFTAKEDIAAGQEVFISYLDDCMLERSRHSRQKYLRENYLFVCNCQRCQSQADEPDVTSDEDEYDDDMEHEDSLS